MDRSAQTDGSCGITTYVTGELKWVSGDTPVIRALQTLLCLCTFKVMFPDQLVDLWSVS